MYGIFEIGGDARKHRVFRGAEFVTIADALASVANIVIYSEIDEENDAADICTVHGNVYSVERI